MVAKEHHEEAYFLRLSVEERHMTVNLLSVGIKTSEDTQLRGVQE